MLELILRLIRKSGGTLPAHGRFGWGEGPEWATTRRRRRSSARDGSRSQLGNVSIQASFSNYKKIIRTTNNSFLHASGVSSQLLEPAFQVVREFGRVGRGHFHNVVQHRRFVVFSRFQCVDSVMGFGGLEALSKKRDRQAGHQPLRSGHKGRSSSRRSGSTRSVLHRDRKRLFRVVHQSFFNRREAY